jgi:hypothetical protein
VVFIVLNFQFLASKAKWSLFTSYSQFKILLRLVYLLLIELARELLLGGGAVKTLVL